MDCPLISQMHILIRRKFFTYFVLHLVTDGLISETRYRKEVLFAELLVINHHKSSTELGGPCVDYWSLKDWTCCKVTQYCSPLRKGWCRKYVVSLQLKAQGKNRHVLLVSSRRFEKLACKSCANTKRTTTHAEDTQHFSLRKEGYLYQTQGNAGLT